MVLALAQDARSEILELLKAVQEDISSLFKLSALVEKVTYRDDYAIAGAAIHDTQILHKELEVRSFSAIERIGLAFAAACTGQQRSTQILEISCIPSRSGSVSSQHVLRQEDDDEVSMEDKIPSIHHSDQISMADVNITGLGSLQEEDEDDHVSQASRDQSTPEISLNQIPTVHTLKELCQGGEVFVCPYCKDKQTMKTEAAWRRHVFSDLKAYVCPAEDCELYMFRSIEAWMHHQLSEHLAVWGCPICREHHPFSSAQLFRAHMCLDHATDFSREQLSQLMTSTKHSADNIRASECQFCDWALILKDTDRLASSTGDIHVTVDDYCHHVCSHLEKLALTVFTTTATVQRLYIDEPEPTPQADTVAMMAHSYSAGSPSSTINSELAPHRDKVSVGPEPRPERPYSSDIRIKFRGLFKSPEYYIKRLDGGSARRRRDEYDPRRLGEMMPEAAMPPPAISYQSSSNRRSPPPSILPMHGGGPNRPTPPQGPGSKASFTTREVNLPPSAMPISRASSSRHRYAHRAVQGLPHSTVPVASYPVPNHTSRRTNPGVSRTNFADTRFRDSAYGSSNMSDTDTPKADSSTTSEIRSSITPGLSSNDRYNYTSDHVDVRKGKEVYRDDDRSNRFVDEDDDYDEQWWRLTASERASRTNKEPWRTRENDDDDDSDKEEAYRTEEKRRVITGHHSPASEHGEEIQHGRQKI
ncbi:hypothetical protein D6C98_07736 [Aureobasidium pullulans]|nr:hypothetical protein D6C98_07736 [Aureobasidium pullulans]